MCCGRRNEPNYLSIALASRLAIETLIGFYDTEEIWHASDKGIFIIKEVRDVLQRLTESNHSTSFLLFNRSCEHFESYYDMKFLQDIVDEIEWITWESDLEQWLANKEKVLDFFMFVEQEALARNSYRYGGCF